MCERGLQNVKGPHGLEFVTVRPEVVPRRKKLVLSGLGPLAETLGTLPFTLRMPPAPDSEAALSSGVLGTNAQLRIGRLGALCS